MDLRPLKNTTLIVVALIYGPLMAFSGALGLFGIPVLIFLSLSLWRYAYEVLRRFAQGRYEDVPAPSIDSMSPLPGGGQLLHFIFFGLALVFLVTTPLLPDIVPFQLARWLILLALLVAFPASAALMSLSNSVEAALSPANIVSCMRGFGERYIVLLGACACLLIAAIAVQIVVLPVFGWFGSVLSMAAYVWTELMLFALIGAALHSRRDVFAIPGEHVPVEEIEADRQRKDWKQSIDLAYASFRSGLAVEGHATIKKLLEAERHSLPVYRWIFDELLTWQDKSTALHFADGYVDRLLDAGLEHEALDLFASCRRRSPDFTVGASQAAILHDYARSIGRHGAADELANLR